MLALNYVADRFFFWGGGGGGGGVNSKPCLLPFLLFFIFIIINMTKISMKTNELRYIDCVS